MTRLRPDPAVLPFEEWPPANQSFFADFRAWLRAGGYGQSALTIYGAAARLALGWLDMPYWELDPAADLDRVREYLAARYDSAGTRRLYDQGLAKLAEYLRLRCGHQPLAPEPPIHWDHYLAGLPAWLAADVRAYLALRRRAWRPEEWHRSTVTILSHLTTFLRWAATQADLPALADLTPALWYAYVDARLAAGRAPATLNGELSELLQFLHFLAESGRPVCARLLQVEPLHDGPHLPRDVPLDQLRRLLAQVEAEAAAPDAPTRRRGLLDRAWFLLMLHSGLRTGEVRRLRLSDLDLVAARVRLEQAKGLQDRVVPLSPATVDALRDYLAVRGPAPLGSDHVFLYGHQPLSHTYCYERLCTYGGRCGVRATPHQLRHSCATLLLNAGAPILTVQTILGHKHIDTTLGYARLYDGTLAADYYRAMGEIEGRLALGESAADPPTSGELLALVDALSAGTLNEAQRETVQALRAAILTLGA